MKAKLIFALACLGILLGLYSAYVYSQRVPAQPPAFKPSANPYEKGIFANGIVESMQANGSNINIYPEVSGPITRIAVNEGDKVHRGDVLLSIEDSVQRAVAEQQKKQADAALALLEELKSQPRPENLEVAVAQVDYARASLKNVQDHLTKIETAYAAAQSVTLDDLDSARNAVNVAATNLGVARRQYELLKAGAWIYDVKNQEMQYNALAAAADAAGALLAKYTLRAPCDGVVMSIEAAVGSYVSAQGAYRTYTQGLGPLIVMGTAPDILAVRVYVDEILVTRLAEPEHIAAKLIIRGTDITIPLTFDRMQPYISPKIELADQRQERVDVRVLPLLFRFKKPPGVAIFPGQLVDVYVGRSE